MSAQGRGRGARGLLVGLTGVALVMAGCLSASDPSPSSTDPGAVAGLLPAVPGAPIVLDHEHGNVSDHLASAAMRYVASVAGPRGPQPGTGYGEVDVKDGWAYVCRGGGRAGPVNGLPETLGGFVVVDVSDPTMPEATGEMPGVGCADIKVNDANDLVFYGTQRNAWYELLTNQAAPGEKLPRGIYLVNVADKTAPRLESFEPLPANGVHTLHYVNMDGRELLLASTYDWIPDSGMAAGLPAPLPATGLNNPALQRTQIYDVERGPDGNRRLALTGVFQMPDLPPAGLNYFPHDVTVQKHPLTGAWLGYWAYWDHGLVIANLDDPAEPVFVSKFDDTSPSAEINAHQARPFPHLIDGKHVTVIEPELSNGDETGQFTLVDTTDPANPQKLGHWTLPGDLIIPGGFLFSPHNFNLANGRIYLAHNHAGVWVVDVGSAERLAQPEAVGFYQTHERDVPCGRAGNFWSAFYVDGHVYATDGCEGLVVLQFEPDAGLAGQGPARVHPAEGVAAEAWPEGRMA